jgi:prepilin-type N-terminal cleavage/methylation domain-containing protein
MARSRSPRNDSGFALIEVIVSAAVLAMVALAVLSGVDGATSATGRESTRSVAASLAEQDQERLRSLQIERLVNYNDPEQTFTIGGITYTVTSAARWVRDDTGNVPSCTDTSKESNYVYISSTVTTAGSLGSRVPPVKLESIVSPPVKDGTLIVQVSNRDGDGVPNLNVSIGGPYSATAPTNADGCALFQYVPAGEYTVTLDRPGWVDRHGDPSATVTKTVTGSTMNLLAMSYDQAAAATLTVKTVYPGTTTALNSDSVDISTINSAEAMRAFPDPMNTTPQPTIAAKNLFPFPAAYNFWTGSCASENPESYTANAGYFAPPGGKTLATDPGGTYAKDIYQPPVNLRVTHDANGKIIGGSGGTKSVDVMSYTATYLPATGDEDCADAVTLHAVTRSDTVTTRGWLSQMSPAYDPGLPFGKWKICVLDTTARKGFYVNSYDNTPVAGQGTTVDLAPDATTYTANKTGATYAGGTTKVTTSC